MKTRFAIQLILLLCGLCCGSAIAAGLEASLDRGQIVEGETVLLKVSAAGKPKGMPDLSPLSLEFEVLDRRQSSRTRVVNNRQYSWQEWDFILSPRRTGQLQIPALQLENLSSEPLWLEVTSSEHAVQLGLAMPVRVEIEVNPEQPLVQSQIDYVVRVLSTLPLREQVLGDPSSQDALIRRLGTEDRDYHTRSNGQLYWVKERRYAVFPQRSGRLAITGPIFQAQVPQATLAGVSNYPGFNLNLDPLSVLDRMLPDGRRAEEALFARTRLAHLRARQVVLTVQPQPPDSTTPWLPAEQLSLSESWSVDPSEWRVGEPIERNLEIMATALTDTQLPELVFQPMDGMTIYPSKQGGETLLQDGELVARKRVSATYVPTRAGTQRVPAMRLTWWDKRAEQQRIAELPERVLEVLPGTIQAAALQQIAQGRQALPSAESPDVDQAWDQLLDEVIRDWMPDWMLDWMQQEGTLNWDAMPLPALGVWPVLSGVFGLAWLVTLWLWWSQRAASARSSAVAPTTVASTAREATVRTPDNPATPSLPTSASESVQTLRQQLQRACASSDAQTTRRVLLAWARLRWPSAPPVGLADLAMRLPASLKPALADLDRSLYAEQASVWQAQDFCSQIEPLMRLPDRPDKLATDMLPPLYPKRS